MSFGSSECLIKYLQPYNSTFCDRGDGCCDTLHIVAIQCEECSWRRQQVFVFFQNIHIPAMNFGFR